MKASLYLTKLKNLTYPQILENDGFANKTADNIFKYFQSQQFDELIDEFSKLEEINNGVEVTQQDAISGTIKGVVCITGSFGISRLEIAQKLESNGYKVTNTISSNLNYLICGDKAGSKLIKAQKLGISIIYDYNELIYD